MQQIATAIDSLVHVVAWIGLALVIVGAGVIVAITGVIRK